MNEREIFTEAMQRPSADERAAYLAQACGSDEPLRQRIEDLIAEQERLGSFLESPAAPRVAGPGETLAFDRVERPAARSARTSCCK